MINNKIPQIIINKYHKPVIYLDGNIMIELSKYENGTYTLENANKEQESFTRYLDTIETIHRHTGLLEKSHSEQEIILTKYVEYLQSAHHHNLPYKWIQANLWAHRM